MERHTQTLNENGTVVREVTRASWSPAQLVVVIIGVLFVVLGGVGLARAGTDFGRLALSHAAVAGLGTTPLSALAELLVGVLVLAGGAYPGTAKATSATFGAALLAFGLIVSLDPLPFATSWAYTTSNGIFFAVVGGLLLCSAAVSPVFSSRREVVRATTAAAEDERVHPNPLASTDSGSTTQFRHG